MDHSPKQPGHLANWLEPLVIGIPPAVLVLVLGFLVGGLDGPTFWKAVFLVATTVLTSAVIAGILSWALIARNIRSVEQRVVVNNELVHRGVSELASHTSRDLTTLMQEVREVTGDFNHRIELLRGELNIKTSSIIADPALADIERSFSLEQIWIVTEELLVELGGSKDPLLDFIDIMRSNLARGVRYTYVIPDRVHLQNRRGAIRKHFSAFLDNGLDFILLSENQWERLPVSLGEYLIYGPQDGADSQVFYLLPTERTPRIRQWIRVGRDLHDYWIGRTAAVLESGRRSGL